MGGDPEGVESTIGGEHVIPLYRLRDGKANLVLFGFMGSGKTTVGRMLARRLGFEFIDLDDEIENETGCAISEIFGYEISETRVGGGSEVGGPDRTGDCHRRRGGEAAGGD